MPTTYERIGDGHVIRAMKPSMGLVYYIEKSERIGTMADDPGCIRIMDGWTPERLRDVADDLEAQQKAARRGMAT